MSRKRPGDRPRRAAPQTEMKSRDGAGTPREGRAQNLVVQLLIVGLAAILLFWNLDWRYLWQDEAATAVLSARMLKFGRPLAYDGVNLITNDNFVAEDVATIDQRTGDPKAAVAYYIERGDLKPDTSWKYQPWGQFMVTAASLALFGKTTLAARLPFAIAALATVILFHGFVRQYFESWRMASLATLLVVLNVYWILHSRQCRYYSLSSLFLILTLITYARWQWGRARFALALFLVTAWCWFQVDYGTVWPVLGVLFLDACWAARWRQAWKPIGAGLILSAAIAPFAYYYELWGRFSVQIGTWADRFHHNLFNLDRFVVPAVALVASAILLIRQWTKLTDPERRLVAIGIGIIVALMFWVPTVAPETFVRYIMPAVSIGALLLAWVLFRLLGRHRPLYLWLAGAVVVFTPALSWPLRPIVPSPTRYYVVPDAVLRPEFGNFYYEIFTRQPDPNRIVIEWLKQNASPSDEILINYEDVPLMFYLPNPIRGGIAAFRTEDDAKTLPRFMIVRRSVIFVHWAVFARVAERHNWVEVSTKAPDDTWGNNPDPMWKVPGLRHVPLLMARRAD